MNAFHLLSGLQTLLYSMFSNFHIEIIFAEFGSLILIRLHVFCAILIFNLGFDEVVFGLSVANEVNHEGWDVGMLKFFN